MARTKGVKVAHKADIRTESNPLIEALREIVEMPEGRFAMDAREVARAALSLGVGSDAGGGPSETGFDPPTSGPAPTPPASVASSFPEELVREHSEEEN
jgi:hypothetical protein